MPDNRGVLREVAWQELFPWLSLLRTLWLALDLRKLLLAAAGIALTAGGWWVIGAALASESAESSGATSPWLWNDADAVPPPIRILTRSQADNLVGDRRLVIPWSKTVRAAEDNLLWLTGPFQALFTRSLLVGEWIALVLSAIWALAVWSVLGGAIIRIAAIDLALEERHGLRNAVLFAIVRWKAYLAAILMPLAVLVLLSVPLAIVGVVSRLDLGLVASGLVWPLVLIEGLLIALLLVGLLLGWPLLWAGISADGIDSFETLSRTYSYVYQRPLHYLFYGLLSGLLGVVGWLAVATIAGLVLHASNWAVGFGTSDERLVWIEAAAAPRFGHQEPSPPAVLPWSRPPSPSTPIEPALSDDPTQGSLARSGLWLIGVWAGCVRLMVLAFGYSFFWTAAAAMYLLLRRDTDGIETDEVFVEEQPSADGLPPLKVDPAGVPVLAEEDRPAPLHP